MSSVGQQSALNSDNNSNLGSLTGLSSQGSQGGSQFKSSQGGSFFDSSAGGSQVSSMSGAGSLVDSKGGNIEGVSSLNRKAKMEIPKATEIFLALQHKEIQNLTEKDLDDESKISLRYKTTPTHTHRSIFCAHL